MIGAQELVDRIAALESDVLNRWIELGWIVPSGSSDGLAFDEARLPACSWSTTSSMTSRSTRRTYL